MFAGRVAVRVKVPAGNAPSFRVLVLLVTGVVLMANEIFVPTGKLEDPAVLKPIVRADVPAPGPPAVLTILMVRLSVPPVVVVKVNVVPPVTV